MWIFTCVTYLHLSSYTSMLVYICVCVQAFTHTYAHLYMLYVVCLRGDDVFCYDNKTAKRLADR